ncbi:hypothetical protein BV25DRAFT_627091 [Artomyces pyxidatus]|uniref:Uncharacterized protein n=1 Tax=Artomyces pyxidatus TaxID=48021 RepID=A0ACB8T345_9AGAM|nr:hypothetical protein BV25DRAFT_627091 [Artomyces pyxidatus]
MSISETVQPNNCIETHPDNHPLYPSFSSLPKKPPLSSESGTQQRSPSSIMPDDVDTIPLKIILGMASAKIKLSALRSSSSIKLVDQALEKRLVDADFCLRRNRCHYAEFLERCIEYGGKAISRSSSSHLRPVFPRSRRAGDLRLQGRTILSRSKQENDSAGLADIVSDAEWTKNRKVLKAGRLLQKIDQNWQALCGRHATVFAKLISLESSNPYPAYTVKQLSKAWRKWTKESEFLRIVMARLGAERPLLRLL